MLAALHGRSDIVNVLISHGAKPDQVNEFGDTAESLAAIKGHKQLAAKLKTIRGSD